MSVKNQMTALADAVRSKSGATGKLSIDKMITAINSISAGSGGSGDVEYYKCAYVHRSPTETLIYSPTIMPRGLYKKTDLLTPSGGEVWESQRSPGHYLYNYVDDTWYFGSFYDRVPGGNYYSSTTGILGPYILYEEDDHYPGEYYPVEDSETYLSYEYVEIDPDMVKTWEGYKAIWNASLNQFTFSEELTTGMPFGDYFVPEVGKIYPADTRAIVEQLWTNSAGDVSGVSFSYYLCDAVYGPKTVKFVEVTGAGVEDCNGRYNDTGEMKNGEPVFKYESSSGRTWYIFYIISEWDENGWVLHDSPGVDYIYGCHYFSSSLQGNWEGGEYGEGVVPTVNLSGEVINADQPKTWSGFGAYFDSEKFVFSTVKTDGLPYNLITPEVGKIYSRDCTAAVEFLYTGLPKISCPVDPDGDKSGDWVISASSYYDSPRMAYKAFTTAVSNGGADGWHSNGKKPAWIQWQNIRQPVLVKNYSILFREDTAVNAGEFLLQGSNDGVIWQTLDTVDNSAGNAEVTRSISNDTPYYCHRIYFTGNSDGGNYIMVYRITAGSGVAE